MPALERPADPPFCPDAIPLNSPPQVDRPAFRRRRVMVGADGHNSMLWPTAGRRVQEGTRATPCHFAPDSSTGPLDRPDGVPTDEWDRVMRPELGSLPVDNSGHSVRPCAGLSPRGRPGRVDRPFHRLRPVRPERSRGDDTAGARRGEKEGRQSVLGRPRAKIDSFERSAGGTGMDLPRSPGGRGAPHSASWHWEGCSPRPDGGNTE